ncbi:MAG: hypothetical protein SH808_03425, partial [Saprospiraceae bacterium]|nr:hypothetical protein [Saprospiraceae bacterium]
MRIEKLAFEASATRIPGDVLGSVGTNVWGKNLIKYTSFYKPIQSLNKININRAGRDHEKCRG